jgi:hypothetical protein
MGVNKFATISRLVLGLTTDYPLFVSYCCLVFVCTKCLAPVGKVYILVS